MKRNTIYLIIDQFLELQQGFIDPSIIQGYYQ